MENPSKGPLDVLKSLWQLVASPTHKRTLSLLILLVVVAAVPLTVFIAQQQQEIRQRAAGGCEGNLTYPGGATCTTTYGNHSLTATWNISGGFGCNVYLRGDQGDERINSGDSDCNSSKNITTYKGQKLTNDGHYKLFISNGDPAGGCYNIEKGDVTIPCAPTAPPCDPTKVNMTVSPNPANTGTQMSFTVGGTQGSTFVEDVWTGGVDCTGGFWGTKLCTAKTAGSYTWTHKWKNCAPNNCNITSIQCQKPTDYTIASGTTPTPTGTPPPGTARLSFNLALTGIGLGDGDNPSPQKRQRNLTVCLYNLGANTTSDPDCTRGIKTGGVVTYDETTGRFINTGFNLGAISGQYQVFVKTNRYLRRRIPQVITITAGQTTQVPQVTLIVGDST